MQIIQPYLIKNHRILLRMDLDVPLENGKVADDFRLEAGLDTLDLCLQYAASVVVMGHLDRPQGQDPNLSVKPVVDWFEQKFAHVELPEGKLHVMENLRFEAGEDQSDLKFAQELAGYGDFYVNEAFAAHHKAASTTLLPTLLPHAAGLRFAKEMEMLLSVRQTPQKPLVVIIGGAKLEDKLAVLNYFAKIADAVLVGGKLPAEIREKKFNFPSNVFIGKMNDEGCDIGPETASSFEGVIKNAKQILWAGPMGKWEESAFIAGTKALAEAVITSKAYSIVGGGDTIAALNKLGYLQKINFVCVGGGAMLKFLEIGTLPTIEALS